MATFGYTSIGSSNASVGLYGPYFCKFTLAEDGTISSITAYLRLTSTAKYKFAIYDSSKNLLAVTEEGTASDNTARWYTLSLATPLSLSAGDYYLAAHTSWYNASGVIAYDAGFTGKDTGYDTTLYSSGFPDPAAFNSSSTVRQYSIYATYTTSTAPIITIKSVSRYKIGCIDGVDESTVVFTANQDLIDFEARAGGIGHGSGLLVGSSGITRISESVYPAETLMVADYSLTSGVEESFVVENEELQQDGVYRINIYGCNSAEEWSEYG